MKAYDMVNWKFLLVVLKAIGVHSIFINWVRECISTLSFSVNLNGELTSFFFFQNKRGFRQGDPISPHLFVIAMEVLSRILARVANHKDFEFHWKSKPNKITHLCFTADLIFFAKQRRNLQLQQLFWKISSLVQAQIQQCKEQCVLIQDLP